MFKSIRKRDGKVTAFKQEKITEEDLTNFYERYKKIKT